MSQSKKLKAMKKSLFLVVLLAVFTSVRAQFSNPIEKRMDSIIAILQRIPSVQSDSARMVLAKRTANYFMEIMINPESWKVDFSRLKNYVSILESSDKLVKVFTWAIPLSSDTYYIGFIQRYDKKSHQVFFYRLYDNSATMKNPQKYYLSPDNWYGCVYYDIHMFKYRKKRIYVLLGADPDGDLLNRKIIEFLTFRASGTPRFGYDVHNEFGKPVRRFIFEYNNQAEMLLRWNKDLKMIVFDHLSPSKPKFKGLHQFYGPDFSYDALKFQKGKFIYEIDVDVRDKNLK